jgi:hypothetical protein
MQEKEKCQAKKFSQTKFLCFANFWRCRNVSPPEQKKPDRSIRLVK